MVMHYVSALLVTLCFGRWSDSSDPDLDCVRLPCGRLSRAQLSSSASTCFRILFRSLRITVQEAQFNERKYNRAKL
jgi:hypothetical protein